MNDNDKLFFIYLFIFFHSALYILVYFIREKERRVQYESGDWNNP